MMVTTVESQIISGILSVTMEIIRTPVANHYILNISKAYNFECLFFTILQLAYVY